MNVIHIDQGTWVCMRQCREAINYLTANPNPLSHLEIKGERDIYNHFMDTILNRAA